MAGLGVRGRYAADTGGVMYRDHRWLAQDAINHDPATGQFTVSGGTTAGEVAEHHGYKKTASKNYSLAKPGKRWSPIAGQRTTETYRHPETGHSITVKGGSWKHNFAKSGGNSTSGVNAAELHEHLTARAKRHMISTV